MRIVGLDGGIASIGWAVIDVDDGGTHGRIVAAGVRCFDPPETDKERTPTNAERRRHRGQRRVIRRRRQRMNAVRELLAAHGLLADTAKDALHMPRLDPWRLRAEALERRLTGEELAKVLGHIARHRGFWSNAKRDRGKNAALDTSAMLKAIEATKGRLQGWRTVGLMFARDPAFAARKRNRDGDYSRTATRDDLRAEARLILERQRGFANTGLTADFAAEFARIAFTQRPLQDSEHLVGACPFEPDQKRTARRAHSFELFRLLSRLANLRLIAGGDERGLDRAQIALVAEDFGRHKKISWKYLRKRLDLAPSTRFADVAPEDEDRDFVARTGNAAEGTYALRDALGDGGWRALLDTAGMADRVAEILTFRETMVSIRAGLTEAGLEPNLIEAVMAAAEAGRFTAFKGAGHISAKAARVLLPHLAAGMAYSDACKEVGYDHAAQTAVNIEDVRNPVARKALGEMVRQVRAIVREYGVPDRFHVELARDVGKSAEERDEITKGIEKRNKAKDRLRAEFTELLGQPPGGAEDVLRFELWKEQGGRCLYSDTAIPCAALVATDNSVQVDHILPWSRFGDDSFINKTLCMASANQRKKNRTPFEWFQAEQPAAWAKFEESVERCLEMKGRKKRGRYLRRNAAEVEEKFRARNLGDTRYATRVLLGLLERHYPLPGQKRTLARPGALTAKLRRAWGLEGLKKTAAGVRIPDDRHHALDAIVIAATTESMLNSLTRAFQQAEERGLKQEFKDVAEPWPGFRVQAQVAVEGVFVSRPERARARGEAHKATIRQVKERDGKLVVFERKRVADLKMSDLDRMKDADRNGATIAALRAWIEKGKPKDAPPRSHKGDEIRKVRLATSDKPAVPVRGGVADRGDMVRVDVFRTVNAKGKPSFHLVPIYPHHVADRATYPVPPDRAVVAYKLEDEWTRIGPGFEFRFSLYPNSLVEVTKPDGELICGYFKGMDRSTGAINLASMQFQQISAKGIGAKTLLFFRKFAVDRLGRVHEIPRETRTWHGVACT